MMRSGNIFEREGSRGHENRIGSDDCCDNLFSAVRDCCNWNYFEF